MGSSPPTGQGEGGPVPRWGGREACGDPSATGVDESPAWRSVSGWLRPARPGCPKVTVGVWEVGRAAKPFGALAPIIWGGHRGSGGEWPLASLLVPITGRLYGQGLLHPLFATPRNLIYVALALVCALGARRHRSQRLQLGPYRRCVLFPHDKPRCRHSQLPGPAASASGPATSSRPRRGFRLATSPVGVWLPVTFGGGANPNSEVRVERLKEPVPNLNKP